MKKYALCECYIPWDSTSKDEVTNILSLHDTLPEAQLAQYKMCGRIYGLTMHFILSEYDTENPIIREDPNLIDQKLKWGDGHAVE